MARLILSLLGAFEARLAASAPPLALPKKTQALVAYLALAPRPVTRAELARLLALDALHEPAHRALMRLYIAQGRRPAALRQYQTCVSSLRRELGVEPTAETQQVYSETLREAAAPAPAATPSGARVRAQDR